MSRFFSGSRKYVVDAIDCEILQNIADELHKAYDWDDLLYWDSPEEVAKLIDSFLAEIKEDQQHKDLIFGVGNMNVIK